MNWSETVHVFSIHLVWFSLVLGICMLGRAVGMLMGRFRQRKAAALSRPKAVSYRPAAEFFTVESFVHSLREPNSAASAATQTPKEHCMPGRTKLPQFTWKMQHHGTPLAGWLMLCLLGSQVLADDSTGAVWHSFQNGGACRAEASLPTKWSPSNLAWRADIEGYGQSTPVVSHGQVVVTSTSGPNKEKYHLSAFHLNSGEKLWQQDFDNPTPEKNSTYVSRAAPTPAVDESGYYAFYEGGWVVAVGRDGTPRWSRNLVDEYGAITARHGLASSLEQDEHRLYVWVERGEAPYLLALAKGTGETIWKVDGVGATTWSTPRLVSVGQGQQLVCSASGKIVGFEPASGKRLWEFSEIANNTSCTPLPVGDGKFFIGASDGRGEENAGRGAASNGVIQIQQADDGDYSADFVWRAQKATCSFGSPVVAGDSVYLVNRGGVLYQLDLKTGKQLLTKRLKAGGIWATPLVARGKLYLFGQKGTTSIWDLESGQEVEANLLWEQVESQEGESSFGGDVLYAAAASGSYLILRRGDMLFAVK